jgi:hypothetical protein
VRMTHLWRVFKVLVKMSTCVLTSCGMHTRRAAPMLLFARQHHVAAAAGDGSGGKLDMQVQLLLGISPHMRNSTYFLGVAAGIDARERRKNKGA